MLRSPPFLCFEGIVSGMLHCRQRLVFLSDTSQIEAATRLQWIGPALSSVLHAQSESECLKV